MKSLKDIAGELGVSVATVSYVNNDKWRENHISPATAKRVKAKIAREHYRPSRLGRQLRTGKTGTIGVLMPDLTRSYNLGILAGIEQVMTRADYMTLLGNSDLGRLEIRQFDAMLERGVEGLILCPLFSRGLAGRVRRLLEQRMPLVMVDNYLPDAPVEYAITDNQWAVAELTRRLLARGFGKIAYFGMGHDKAVLRDRFLGYTTAIREAGMDPNHLPTCRGVEKDLGKHLQNLLQRDKPDALITSSFIYFNKGVDILAGYAAESCPGFGIAGVDVPDPVSLQKIMAGNGTRPFGCLVYAEQQAEAMGAAAATRLLQISGRKNGEALHLKLKPKIRFLTEEDA